MEDIVSVEGFTPEDFEDLHNVLTNYVNIPLKIENHDLIRRVVSIVNKIEALNEQLSTN